MTLDRALPVGRNDARRGRPAARGRGPLHLVPHRTRDRCGRWTGPPSPLTGAGPSASSASPARARRCWPASIMGLLPGDDVERSGSVRFEGSELMGIARHDLRSLWGARISMVFQDPMTSLNPVMRIGRQITESLRLHLGLAGPRPGPPLSPCSAGGDARARAALPLLPGPALGRHAPTGRHRHRHRLRPAAPPGRRAHDRSRRHGPGPDPRPARRLQERGEWP